MVIIVVLVVLFVVGFCLFGVCILKLLVVAFGFGFWFGFEV